jgi:hypothetical protein
MIRISVKGKDFTVSAGAYRFAFFASDAAGVLETASRERVLELAFTPMCDGEPAENFAVVSNQKLRHGMAVRGRTGRGELDLVFQFFEQGFVYSYSLDAARSFGKFTLGAIRGDFRQVHSFVPDLARFDIPEKVATPLQINSRQATYDRFLQLDGGSYMLPPYLVALDCGAHLAGFGVLDVPDTENAFDATVTRNQLAAQFDYGARRREGEYASPRFGVFVADSREGILEAYRESVRPVTRPEGKQPPWWRNPIYTTWGDQVYRKHIEEGRFTSEAGAEKYLSGALVDEALAKLRAEQLAPGTIVLDVGWARALGDWEPDDAKFGGSLAKWIRAKHAEGLHVLLYFNPFLAHPESKTAAAHPEFLFKDANGQPRAVQRSGQKFLLFDWSNAAFREQVSARLADMVGATALEADGIKIAGTKSLPAPGDTFADWEYGTGEKYLHSVLRDIHAVVKRCNPDALISLNCLNPLFSEFFDVVRTGNCSEVNHDCHVLRAHAASWLLPEKPVDTDDWAAFSKVLGATTFIKAVAGVPNIFSAFYRGDGRLRVQGAMGGCPVQMTKEQYHIVSAAWKIYEFARGADRGRLHIDYDRLEFATCDGRLRTYQGGNILAAYTPEAIYLASLLDTRAIIDLPGGFEAAAVDRVDRSGAR